MHRLFTGHMVRSSGGGGPLSDYVRLACGADPRLFPTLLGLRLVTDPRVRWKEGRGIS